MSNKYPEMSRKIQKGLKVSRNVQKYSIFPKNIQYFQKCSNSLKEIAYIIYGCHPRKQQRATNVIARGHAASTNVTQWHRQETHAAIASLNEIKWH